MNTQKDIQLYTRMQMPEVQIGNVTIGGTNVIAVQSMTNTDTNAIDKSIEQCKRIFDAGAHYVRLTAQGVKEAEALREIKQGLVQQGYTQPLVADIHFNPQAAIVAAQYVEKIRINPGNYVTLGSLTKTEYSEEEYAAELDKIAENLRPLLQICKKHNTAIRIGVNHGSLSNRIVNKYGDTPQGMVMSMIEFLRICNQEQFTNVVCSIKASNTRIMVYATRLLAHTMQQENLAYPIHLGVTEAGAGEDGRIKSAVGIGTLLLEGIGDTIRVSLTEAPEKEIPVCKSIVAYSNEVCAESIHTVIPFDIRPNIFAYNKFVSHCVYGIGGQALPIVVSQTMNIGADWVFHDSNVLTKEDGEYDLEYICFEDLQAKHIGKHVIIEIEVEQIHHLHTKHIPEDCILVLRYGGKKLQYWIQKLYAELQQAHCNPPIILRLQYDVDSYEELQIRAAMDAGSVFIDGFCDGLWIENQNIPEQQCVELAFAILQATRARFSKTEFIACPSCGRTLFNIEQALIQVKAKTNHLQGLKIAVMGCIVNGPGEMADADYGYVGAGRGMVHLYRRQELVKKNIPEHEAVDALIALIRENGDWK
ncbi:MAG TPA: (E)-4-hydroxy-3-methylbut-2-enyl-diphosphate synthase [Bacteroidales bacterium]|nr:(E)-4-hydroxy-3-methylbut-2-enyl-diphosphate synthase [Bacteroidales bacterium]